MYLGMLFQFLLCELPSILKHISDTNSSFLMLVKYSRTILSNKVKVAEKESSDHVPACQVEILAGINKCCNIY